MGRSGRILRQVAVVGTTPEASVTVETSLPVGGLVFDKERFFYINQTTDLEIIKASSGHNMSNRLIHIHINIIGNETNTITNSIIDTDLDGDTLKNVNNNYITLVGLNGYIVEYRNKNSVLPEVADIVAPLIYSESLASDNSYVDITFTEGVYHSDGSYLTTSNFTVTNADYTGDDATSITIASVTKVGGGALTGGETTIRVNLTFDTPSNGTTTFDITVTTFEDLSGNTTLTDTTGTIICNDVSVPSFHPSDLSPLYFDETTRTFNGVSDFINMGASGAFISVANFSAIGRISPADGRPSAQQTIIGLNSTNGAFNFAIKTDGAIRIAYRVSSSLVYAMDTVVILADGAIPYLTWEIYKIGDNWTFYLDGTPYTLTPSSTTSVSGDTTMTMYNGANHTLPSDIASAFYAGSQKALFWKASTLSPAEITSVKNYINAL